MIDSALAARPSASNPDPHVISGRSRAVLLAQAAVLLYRAGRYHEVFERTREALAIEATYRLANLYSGHISSGTG